MKLTVQVQFGTGVLNEAGVDKILQELYNQLHTLKWQLRGEVKGPLAARQTYEVEVYVNA